MSVEFLVWLLLPMVFGIAMLIVSAACAQKKSSAAQRASLLLVLSGVAWSEWLLFAMVRGAWPTFLPHIVLGLVLVVVIVQVVAVRANSRN